MSPSTRLCFFIAILCCALPGYSWDDPLGAMPTAHDSISAKVGRLSPQSLSSLSLPETKDVPVLRIAKIATDPPSDENHEPWIEVQQDRRIKCTSSIPGVTSIATDRISRDELTWLLHLAVNECSGLDQSTNRIAVEYARHGKARSAMSDERSFHYVINAGRRHNAFAIPERALTSRQVRAKMDLGSFVSLHRYVSYLTARAFLGSSEKREQVLASVNEELFLQHPGLPPFEMWHLAAAMPGMFDTDMAASFIQELPLGDNGYQKVTATVIRKTPDADLATTFNLLEFQKD